MDSWGVHTHVGWQLSSPPLVPGPPVPGEAGASAWTSGFVYGWEHDGRSAPSGDWATTRAGLPAVFDQGYQAARELRQAEAKGLVELRWEPRPPDPSGAPLTPELFFCGNRADPWFAGFMRGFKDGRGPKSGLPRGAWLLGLNLIRHMKAGWMWPVPLR